MHIDELYKIFITHPHITTDTRKIEPGSIFFALKGDRFNGNAFAEQAVLGRLFQSNLSQRRRPQSPRRWAGVHRRSGWFLE